MKLFDILNWIVGIGVTALIISILFVPLPVLSKYGFMLLMTIIVLGVLGLVHSALVFVRDIPKRKWNEQKAETPLLTYFGLKVKTWKSVGEWGFMLIVIIVLLQFQRGNLGSKECPDIIRGNSDSTIVVQYFYSPFCPACWKGERIAQQLLDRYPGVRLENYDARYCKRVMLDAEVRGSPAYRFQSANASQIVYGVDKEQIENTFCAMGGCV